MPSRRPPKQSPPARPRLYLVAPPVAQPASLRETLAAVVAATDVAAVLLRLEPADDRTLIDRVRAFAPAVQDRGVALLLDRHAALASHAGADGAHLDGLPAFEAAAGLLKPDRIAGCGGLHSRDDAMTAGERGADYVMFGEPEASGRRPAFEAIVDRIAWWAELFEVPCVAWAANLEEVQPLAAAGADFVALGEWLWTHPEGPANAARAAGARLGVPEPVP
jgi:thiamine-phosphate pyrophosphorylase